MSNPFDQFDAAEETENPFDAFEPAPAKAVPAEGSARSAPRKRSIYGEVAGAMANFNRGLGIGDELAAGAKTVGGLLSGDVQPSGLLNGFRDNMAAQRKLEDEYIADRPVTGGLLKGFGMAGTAVVPAGGSAGLLASSPRWLNVGRGATAAALSGAGYAAVDRGSGAERLAAASDPIMLTTSAVLGGLAGALGPAASKPKPVRQAVTDGDVLADVGVSTSIPQRMGRAAKGVEDLLKRFPITGQAMAGYQDRQIGQLNRAVALKALAPIGEKLPREVKPGFEMVEYVDDALGKVYDRAAELAPTVPLDEQLVADFADIGARKVDLADSEAAQFDRIITDRLNRLQGGGASGKMVKKIHSELGTLQAEASRKGNTTLASMLGDTRRALMGLVERASPEAGKLIRAADRGWGVYSIMNDAAASASARGGVFLPGQLNTQVRTSAKAMGSNMAGKGKGPLQDIATAASRTIPDSYGNPGTANAGLLAGGGWGAITDPGKTAVAATALGAAATPYLLMGRKILEELPETASRSQLQAAAKQLAELAAKDDAVVPLAQKVAARLAVLNGVVPAGMAGTARGGVESIEVGGHVYAADGTMLR